MNEELKTRRVLGTLNIPFVVHQGREWAVFDLAMNEARATDLGKHDWRVALEEEAAGKMLMVPLGGKYLPMFCVPMPVMVLTLINIATMPERGASAAPW